VRSGDFYPSDLEKGTRTDQAVHLALAEMVVQGVSTRRVIGTMHKLRNLWHSSEPGGMPCKCNTSATASGGFTG
jgi:transposase-like protein